MEKAPLVSDVEVALSEEEDEQQAVNQPLRSPTMRRTGIALMVLGLVGAVLLVGTAHNQMVVANVGNAEAKWGMSNMWNSVKSHASSVADHASSVVDSVKDHASNVVSEHASNLVDTVKDHAGNVEADLGALGDHANNLVDTVKGHASSVNLGALKDHASNLVDSVKGHVSNLKNGAEDAIKAPVCDAIKKNLPKLKLRWVHKMAADLMDDKSVCGKDFKSDECRQSFLNDACPMGEGVRKEICGHIFTGVIKDIQARIPQAVMGTQQTLNELPLVENSLNMEMGTLDAKVVEFCK